MSYNYNYDYLFKLVIIGDSGVGKSSILTQFTDRIYADDYISTIGIDFKIRTIDLDGKIVKLQLWDTTGQERFRTITTSYYRGSHGIIIVYDVCNRQSFNRVPNWLGEVRKYVDVPLLLIGNKIDIKQTIEVTTEEGEKMAKDLGMAFVETSAKSNINITHAFLQIAQEMQTRCSNIPNILNIPNNSNNKTPIILLSSPSSSKKSCCSY